MTAPTSIPSTPSLAASNDAGCLDALASAVTMPNGGTRPPDAFQDARTGKTCPEATFHHRRLHRCAALTGLPGGPLPILPSQPGGATDGPAPDFARLMMPPVAPAGDATNTTAAVPAPPPQSTPGSSTRLNRNDAAGWASVSPFDKLRTPSPSRGIPTLQHARGSPVAGMLCCPAEGDHCSVANSTEAICRSTASLRLKLTAGGPNGAAPLTREQIEAAAAMLAPLWQMVSNLAPEPPPSSPTSSIGGVANPPNEGTETSPMDVPAASSGPAPRFTLHVDDHPVPGFEAVAALPANDLSALTAKLESALAEPATSEPSEPATGDSVSLQFALPDGRMVRAEAAVTSPTTLPQADQRNRTKARLTRVAKNAASPVSPGNSAPAADLSANKNFLNVEGANDGVKGARVGIPVAQPRSAMAAPSSERPTADELIVQAFVPENRPASAAPLADIREHRPAAIAQRAVEAVVEVVEAQAATRLQPAPGVQLHLKLGGEDIAIRVELREGSVHTQFRTDSPEVRQAIAQEWSVLQAESPERTLRYLEPEFPADPAGSAPGGSGRHGAASHQQSRPPQPEIFGAVARSYPYNRTEADSPVLEIAARVLPTSVHLSAVA